MFAVDLFVTCLWLRSQVVPRALLDFSRYIMRERFSALIRKAVYTFQFDRFQSVTQELYRKLVKARNSRAIVVTTPTDVKAFFLKYAEIVHAIDRAHSLGGAKVDIAALRQQAKTCVRILEVFFSGALLMDEVDLVLHPLKSELNFPIGTKEPLDLTQNRSGRGLRWQLPWHLLDALFAATEGRMSVQLQGSVEADKVLAAITSVVERGSKLLVLQRTPHLVLLSRRFYHRELKPLLVRWAVLWFGMQRRTGIKDAVVEEFLNAPKGKSTMLQADKLDDEPSKTLNLCHDLLHSVLPFVLSKIDRVSYGLLSEEQIVREKQSHLTYPRSRWMTAVPFVGKDVASERSEFAHPDIVISLTVLAFRYEGLRRFELKNLLKSLQHSMWEEQGPFSKRPSSRMYEHWVHLAGSRVRGSIREAATSGAGGAAPVPVPVERCASSGAGPGGGNSVATVVIEDAGAANGSDDMWPLRLLDLEDDEQMDAVFALLRRLPEVIWHCLHEKILPQVLRHQAMKLSASGQELGGDMLFRRRLGFSGTPSELLPLELGKCHYHKGTDGKLQHVLTSPSVVGITLIEPNWSVKSLLDSIANSTEPVFHALIDTGALITGMTNLEVATHLLCAGLPWCEGLVFLDQHDRKMMLLRRGLKVVPMHQCDIHKSRRFAFYDQVHTTGMDLEHALNAKAVLTLGKDMTFRDYAQGAYRMRGIGKGQNIQLFVIPEVCWYVGMHACICIPARICIHGSLVQGACRLFCYHRKLFLGI